MRVILVIALVLNILHPSLELWSLAKTGLQSVLGRKNQAQEECFRLQLQNGLPDFGVPALEPLDIPYLKIDLEQHRLQCLEDLMDDATGSVVIENLECNGLTQWTVADRRSRVTSYMPIIYTEALSFSFRDINCRSEYRNLNGNMKGLNVVGSGEVEFVVDDLILNVTINYQVTAKEVQQLKIVPELKQLKSFTITGVNFNTKLSDGLSEAILYYAPDLLRANSERIDVCIQEVLSYFYYNGESVGTHIVNKCL